MNSNERFGIWKLYKAPSYIGAFKTNQTGQFVNLSKNEEKPRTKGHFPDQNIRFQVQEHTQPSLFR